MHLGCASFLLLTSLISIGCTKYEYVPPKVHANPKPKDIYNVTLTLDDRFGSPTTIGIISHLAVKNPTVCAPKNTWAAIGGLYPHPSEQVTTTAFRLDKNTYKFTLVLDPFVDEDYYGLGVCNWELEAASIEISYENWGISASFAPQRHNPPDDFLLFCNYSDICGEVAPPDVSRAIQVKLERAAS